MSLQPFVETVPGTTLGIEMVPIPRGTLQTTDAQGAVSSHSLGPFYISAKEITWDAFDAFVFGLDVIAQPQTDGSQPADAITRPSKPYIMMDRGFGHGGYPAISMSQKGAAAFCTWLSHKSGRIYRLPTEAEWEYACRAGSQAAWAFGADPAGLDAVAWYRASSDGKTHPVGSLAPNAYGLYDVHGNAAEWCVSEGNEAVVRGGSYRDDAEGVSSSARVAPSPAWNASDPQIPKSSWWLADAGFVGFRVVCEGDSQSR